MSSVLLLGLGIFAVLTLWLVQLPPRRPGEIAVSLFMWSWLAGEHPLHLAAGLVAGAGLLVGLDGLANDLGIAGLGLVVIGLVGPILSWREASRVQARAAAALGAPLPRDVPLWRYVLPAWSADRSIARRHVRTDGVELDLYAPRAPASDAAPRPVLVYVHGGGWVLGFRRFQGRLFIRRLVRRGWLAVSLEYRRWPRVTWPAPLHDVRQGLAWVRANIAAHGGDPAAIVLSGNSAGAHLAALVALTDDAAPPLSACVAWYGVFDLVDAAGRWPHDALERLWAWLILRQGKDEAPEAWRGASPVAHVHAGAPPFLVVHGTRDSLVPIAAARDFVKLLSEATGRAVPFHEVEGAQHAFDVFTSRRGAAAVELAARFAEAAVADGRDLTSGPGSPRGSS